MSVKELFKGKQVKRLGDPEGVMAVLQIARRLLKERGDGAVYVALDEALDLAAPKDRARAWWAAHRMVVRSLPAGTASIGDFEATSPSSDDVLELMAVAIRKQGVLNIQAAKGKRQ